MRRIYLRDCAAGDVIDDVFVVSNKQLAQASNGTHYIKAFISDRTTQVSGRMWKASREIFGFLPESGFAKIRARIENYQGNLQAIIETVGPAADGTYDIGDLLPCTTKNVEEMFGKLSSILGSVRNKHLAAIVHAYLRDERLMTLFKRSPAAQSFHHAWIGGLLEHTLNAVEVGDGVCKFYPLLNRDLVITGLFLHDIAKTWELKYDAAFGYTDGGQLIGHIVKSAMWLEHKSGQAAQQIGEAIPRQLIDVLQHIILSHHGELEFGSPKTPATPEAFAVHMIENMDAKLTLMLGLTRGEGVADAEGNWTEYVKAVSGRLYRPDVAPADMPALPPAAVAVVAPPTAPAAKPAVIAPAAVPAAAPIAPVAEPAAHGQEKQVPESAARTVTPPAAVTEKPLITNPLFDSGPARRR